MGYTPLRDVPALVRQRATFRSNSMHAEYYPDGVGHPVDVGWGEGPGPGPDAVYIVWSYDTPIAWVGGDGYAHKVTQKFSRTTSRHQGLLYTLRHDPHYRRLESLAIKAVLDAMDKEAAA